MRPEEGWSNADGSRLLWRTLLSADRDGPASMCAGVAEVPVSSDALTLHRHAQEELYFVVSGHGEVKIDDMVEEIGPGSCVFVPRNSWHTISNPGPDILQLFYCFPTASFSDVVYEYSPDVPAPQWHGTADHLA